MTGKYNKLVRDKIPVIIEKQGEKAITKILNQEDYRKQLEMKLLEEVNEVIESNKANCLEELADVLEVITCLAEIYGSNINEVQSIQEKKKRERGSFKERIYLVEVQVCELSK